MQRTKGNHAQRSKERSDDSVWAIREYQLKKKVWNELNGNSGVDM